MIFPHHTPTIFARPVTPHTSLKSPFSTTLNCLLKTQLSFVCWCNTEIDLTAFATTTCKAFQSLPFFIMRRARTAFVTAAPLALRSRRLSLCPNLRPYTHLACRRQALTQVQRITPLASVQQETPWNRVRVVENSSECEAHRYIVVNVGITTEKGSLCDEYRVPGMFVQMRHSPEEKPFFFALACAPNVAGYFEFIVKETENTKSICSVKVV